eukprot:10689459-Lingulodinium_polyedra.AAC.1
MRHTHQDPTTTGHAPLYGPRAHCSATRGHRPPPLPGRLRPVPPLSPPAVSPASSSRAGQPA